ncbi:serine/threonine protein kinase [Oscillatoriales cyanobacterium USR001]|nr:serine/threonine protein kinase [Oscillatoriales cyanobacterium USR001]
MNYCINPNCQAPQNRDRTTTCSSCGREMLLKNRYRILHTLGQSVSGRTFLAIDEDQPSHPRCVIKQLFQPAVGDNIQSELAETNFYFPQRFHVAALLLDKLGQHPQIPELWASFEHDGCLYLVQQYIAGRSLAEELSEKGNFGETAIWQLLGELLPVLQLIHDSQLIHRDLKPENIIRRSHQAPFKKGRKGELTLVDFGAATPMNGSWPKTKVKVGSAEYAAPEQIKGAATNSSDLYSLGVICIYLLTGLSPFDLFDIKSDTWVWRDYLKVPVSDRLSRILDKMIQRDPMLRYQSATEALKDVKVKVCPTPIALGRSKQNWALTAWSAAAIAILSIALNPHLPSLSPQMGFKTSKSTAKIPDFRFSSPRLNDFTSQRSPNAPVRTLASTSGPVWSVAVIPNGRAVATGNTDGTIRLLHLCSGKLVRTMIGHSGAVWAVAVSPDGRAIASGGADNTIKLWDIYSGELIRTFYGHTAGVFSVAFSPDGKAIASVSKDKTVKLWQVETGIELETLKGHSAGIQSVAFTPNGEILATGSDDGTIKLWNWQTGELVRTLAGHTDAVWSVAVSPDGQTLASGSWDNTIKLWDLNTSESPQPNGYLLRTLNGHLDKVQSLAFSPDGQTLASGDLSGTIKLWQMGSGGLMGTLKGHSSWVEVAFSPRGKTLVSGSFDDTIKVWRLSP